MDLVIRHAVLGDAPQLAELAGEAFRRTYDGMVEASAVDSVVAQTCTAEAFVGLIRSADGGAGLQRLLVALDGTSLLGFLDFAEEPDGLELRRLYTRVGSTSRGIGSALLTALESSLPPGTHYRIVVVAQNVRGLQFWKAHGFSVRGDVDGVDHFRTHRGVSFGTGAPGVRLLVLDRRTGLSEPETSRGPGSAARPGAGVRGPTPPD